MIWDGTRVSTAVVRWGGYHEIGHTLPAGMMGASA